MSQLFTTNIQSARTASHIRDRAAPPDIEHRHRAQQPAAWSIAEPMAFGESGEFIERRFAMGIPCTFVFEHGRPSDAAMPTDLG
jgi:hypothetical protein